MSRNGNGVRLHPNLMAVMSGLRMPEIQDFPRLPAPIEPDLTGIEDPNDPYVQTSYEKSYESRTSEPESEVAAVIRTMKETGCAHEEIKEVVAILANKHQPSYDNRTSLVRESDAELKIRRKKEYDKKYQRARYVPRARDTESKNLVREVSSQLISSSLTPPLSEEYEEKKEETGSTRARAHALPDDWSPNEKHFELAQSLGHSRQDVLTFAADMRDWTKANAGRAVSKKTEWNAAFNNWIRRQRRPTNARPGPGISTSQPRKENGAERAFRLKQEALAGQPGGGLSDSAEGLVELDPSEWSSGTQTRANGHGAKD